jgi:hypothetical protein
MTLDLEEALAPHRGLTFPVALFKGDLMKVTINDAAALIMTIIIVGTAHNAVVTVMYILGFVP